MAGKEATIHKISGKLLSLEENEKKKTQKRADKYFDIQALDVIYFSKNKKK